MISLRLLFIVTFLLASYASGQETGTGEATGTGEGPAQGSIVEETTTDVGETTTGIGETTTELPATTGDSTTVGPDDTTVAQTTVAAEGGSFGNEDVPEEEVLVPVIPPKATDVKVEPDEADTTKPQTAVNDGTATTYQGLLSKEHYCKISVNHTGCLYTGLNQLGKCNATTLNDKNMFRGVTPVMKEIILRVHNEKRSRIALGKEDGVPTAANMVEMEWDDELAALAQVWADQCIFKHDSDKSVQRNGEILSVGQNAWTATWNSMGDWDDDYAVGSWYDELQKPLEGNTAPFTKGDVSAYASQDGTTGRGHFTQLIWAKSAKMGCGSIQVTPDNVKTVFTQVYCNYLSVGNVEGAPIYEMGKACSKCPREYTVCKKDKGLCTKG